MMIIQDNMTLILVSISGKNSGLPTICFSENTFYINSVHFKGRMLDSDPEIERLNKPFQLKALKI